MRADRIPVDNIVCLMEGLVRRDAYIENDSDGFSVVSGTAVDRIEDGRQDDEQFVRAGHALLLLLVGDDSLPVRIVVDEPLSAEEEREWLARYD